MYRTQIQKEGYTVLKSVFSKEQLEIWKHDILTYTRSTPQIKNGGGITIPDFIKRPELASVSTIKDHPIIQNALRDIFDGSDYRFCGHNDIGVNRLVGWHKDKLNGLYAKYEKIPIWSTHNGEQHEIVKVLIYLEDHATKDGLTLVPGSHLLPTINTKGAIYMSTEPGDVLIFDQRISHKGMEKQVDDPRILISFGFGKNNVFTDQFEEGTVARQTDQNNLPK